MDLLAGYGSDDNSDEGGVTSAAPSAAAKPPPPSAPTTVSTIPQRADRRVLNSAPAVPLTTGRRLGGGDSSSTALTVASSGNSQQNGNSSGKQGALVLMNNPTKDIMYQPVQGPQVMDPSIDSGKTHGQLEQNVAFDESTFREQRAAFQRSGQALGPDEMASTDIVRTTRGYARDRIRKFVEQDEARRKKPRPNDPAAAAGSAKSGKKKEKEPLVYGSDDEVEFGVWAPPSAEERYEADNKLTDIAKEGIDGLAPEQLVEREYLKERDRQRGIEQEKREDESSFDRLLERKMAHLLPPKMGNDEEPCEPSTTFHGKAEVDYRGRPWTAPPVGLGADIIHNEHAHLPMDHHRCFVPKKCVHRFTGHNKGVQRIRLFPQTGHLLLSAGLDGKCKVWSVPDKQVMRTYIGHTAGVRDVQFNHDGSKFVSASFDRFLRLWDTTSGKVLQTFTNKKVPYVVKFYPHDDNLFVVGCSDSKIVTYDATTAAITQEYNHHLAPVNAILFVEDHGTKMVTSSDDKKILVWEWDIGVPIKYISDPTMHSIPCLVMHPSETVFCGQSLDNTIVTFQAGPRYTLQRKSKYSGHVVSGYACEMALSPDGQYLTSGDGTGQVFFWDWKKHKILQKYRAHANGPAICCAWHPLEPSVMFTCGWDGLIKMWQ